MTFRSVAIKILSESNKPLSSSQIVNIALTRGELKTAGHTPDATMSAIMYSDMKENGSNSPFKLTKKATFTLNPNYNQKHTKTIRRDRNVKVNNNDTQKLPHHTQYVGKSGEYRVLSELLIRNYNANIMSVDSGVDIIAIKDNQTFKIQVKTANSRNDKYIFSISKKSFFPTKDLFYVLFLRDIKKEEFIIVQASVLKDYINRGDIKKSTDDNYKIYVETKNGNTMIGSIDVQSYVNNWDVLH